jgi:membrane-associated phospholipid phosphatase
MRTAPNGRGARLPSIALALAVLATAAVAPSPARADEPGPPRFTDRQHFTIDPVVDGMFVLGGATFDELLSLILSTGEIRPVLPGSQDKLLSIDRYAVTQTIDPNAGRNSDFGLWAAYGYAILDPILSGVRDGRRAFLVDAILYAESFTIASAATEVTKIAVRRSRPIDYKNCGVDPAPAFCQDNTNLQLSFFSGHASATAALSATATYLAFVRSGWRSKRPWITLAAGTLLTAFVSYERVRSGDHFPTDVIVGSMVGGGIGVLVPHLHRRPHYHDQELDSPPLIIGYAPTPGGGSVTAQVRF